MGVKLFPLKRNTSAEEKMEYFLMDATSYITVNPRISPPWGLFIFGIFGWGLTQGGGLIRGGLIKLL